MVCCFAPGQLGDLGGDGSANHAASARLGNPPSGNLGCRSGGRGGAPFPRRSLSLRQSSDRTPMFYHELCETALGLLVLAEVVLIEVEHLHDTLDSHADVTAHHEVQQRGAVDKHDLRVGATQNELLGAFGE